MHILREDGKVAVDTHIDFTEVKASWNDDGERIQVQFKDPVRQEAFWLCLEYEELWILRDAIEKESRLHHIRQHGLRYPDNAFD